jgi:hypothetical protein
MRSTASRVTALLLAVAVTAIVAEFFLYDDAHVRVPPIVASVATPESAPSQVS